MQKLRQQRKMIRVAVFDAASLNENMKVYELEEVMKLMVAILA
jgi:hypothetical protein